MLSDGCTCPISNDRANCLSNGRTSHNGTNNAAISVVANVNTNAAPNCVASNSRSIERQPNTRTNYPTKYLAQCVAIDINALVVTKCLAKHTAVVVIICVAIDYANNASVGVVANQSAT